MGSSRDLIFAILALRLRGVSGEEIAAAGEAIASEPSTTMVDRLGESGALTAQDIGHLQRVAHALVEAHGGDVEAALEFLGGSRRLSEFTASLRPAGDSDAAATTPMADMPFNPADMEPLEPLVETPGRYTSVSEHGRGGMGRVFLVHDVKMGRDIALKELMPSSETSHLSEESPLRNTAAIAARFLQEGRITAGLEHPSIVPVYELGKRPSGRLYYTMRLVKGRTLSETLRSCRTLDSRLALLPHFLNLCQAIAYAHSRGVIHRDIKPSNVMIGEFGETVVLDWGIAKVKKQPDDLFEEELREMPKRLAEAAEGGPETVPGAVMGTPDYMAPEQAKGQTDLIDEKSDVYALGVVLYELLSGTRPFRSQSASETLRRVVVEDPISVLDREPQAPPELATICHGAMLKDRERRCESVKDLAAEIQRYQTGALVQSYRYGLKQLVKRFYTRHRAIVNTVAAAVAVVIGLGILSFVKIYEARNREHEQRLVAENARDAAIAAERERGVAQEKAEGEAYVAQIRLLQAYVRERNFAGANNLLWSLDENRRNWEWGYLLGQCNQDLLTLRGHESIVYRARYSPDGQQVLTLAGDHSARLWRAHDGIPLTTIQTSQALITDGCFSPDGSKVLLSLRDNTARVFDAVTGEAVGVFKGHSGAVNTARFFNNGARVITASNDRTVRLWDTETLQELARLEGHEGDVKGAYTTRNGEFLASVTRGGRLRLWREGEASPMRTFAGRLPKFSPSGTRLTFIQDEVAVVWDLASDEEIFRTEAPAARVVRVRFSPQGERVLTASEDGMARLYSLDNGALLASFNHGEEARDAQMSPDENLLFVLSTKGLATVWDVATGTLLNRLVGHEAGVGAAVFSPDGRRIATVSRDCTARIWDARNPIRTATISSCPKTVKDLAVSLNGRRIGLVSQDRTLRLIDGVTLEPTDTHAAFSHFGPASVAFNTSAELVAVPLDEFSVFVLKTGSGKLVSRFAGHRGRVSALSFSPVIDRVVSAGDDGVARIWDARTGAPAIAMEGHEGRVGHTAFSPDGRLVATASVDRTVRLWNAESGAMSYVLEGHAGEVNSVAFSPDGSYLLSAASDGAVFRWSVATGELNGKLEGHADRVTSAAYSPDSSRIVTGSWDQTVRVWDADTSEELLLVARGAPPVSRTCFSHDGQRLLVADWDGKAIVYSAAPWRSEQLEGYAAATFAEQFEQAKRQRADEHEPVRTMEPPAVLVHTTSERLSEHLARLERVLEATTEDVDPEALGVAIGAGPRANAVARLCLEPGDVITAFNGATVESGAAAREALAAFLDMPNPAQPLRLEVLRAGKTIQHEYVTHERFSMETTVTLTREEAHRILQYMAVLLDAGKESLLQVNRDHAVRVGEPREARTGLSGFWLPSGGPPEVAEFYRQLGVAPHDRILSVNETALDDLSQVRELVSAAIKALETQNPKTAAMAIDRGEFQRISLRIAVE